MPPIYIYIYICIYTYVNTPSAIIEVLVSPAKTYAVVYFWPVYMNGIYSNYNASGPSWVILDVQASICL